MSETPTDGPPDNEQEDPPRKIIFPSDPTKSPAQFINDQQLTTFEEGIYYTNPSILHQAVLPLSTDKTQLMRVWTLKQLQTGTRREVQYENWPNYEAYRYNLQNRAITDNRRKAGILIYTNNGNIRKYRVVVAGQQFRINLPPPDPISQLISKHRHLVPDRLGGIIRLPEIVMQENQVVGQWTQLHRVGIYPIKILVPHEIISQVWCRFRLSNRGMNISTIKLEIEGFIVERDPGEKAKSTLRDDIDQLLKTSAAPTFIIWSSTSNIQWDISYPTLSTHFTTKWPVPVICEQNPNCNIRPSEFASRRTVHDVMYKAGWGSEIDSLRQ